MTETVSSGADARLKLTEPSKDTVQTSYALRLDRGSDNEVKNIETFSQYALRNLQDMDIVYPGTNGLRRSARRGSHRISPTLKSHSTPMTMIPSPMHGGSRRT